MSLRLAAMAAWAALLLIGTPADSKDCGDAVVEQAGRIADELAEQLPPLRKAPFSDARTRRVLLAAAGADQALRNLVVESLGKCLIAGDPRLKQLGRAIRAVNDAGADALTEILDKDGWPLRSRFGDEVDRAAFLIVQHRDHDVAYQARVLERLADLVTRGETLGESYALLFDRVATAQGRPQRYGSQGECRDGQFVVHALEPGDVDARRQTVGLPALDAYRALAASRFCGRR
jgi:hypothetical protein